MKIITAYGPVLLPLFTGLESQSDCITQEAFQLQERVSISKGKDEKGFSPIYAYSREGKAHFDVCLH